MSFTKYKFEKMCVDENVGYAVGYALDEYQKLKQENEKLRKCVENLINATEYGVNQWQEAWLPNEETKAQKAIRVARKILKELEHNQ